MKRRDFIIHTSLAALAIPAVFGACDSRKPSAQAVSNDTGSNFELEETTIDDLQKKMADGSYSAEQIANLYLKRIDEIDRNGIALNSIIELNPDAVEIARQMDKERKDGKVRGPLHGIPVLIKDNIDTADSMMSTAGSLAMEGNHASKDAFIVQKLREAGAVILGKTNLSEWANFRSTRSVSGWSSRGGQTKNPYILDRSPCGSSSGSGTAVSANLCVVAIGTETNGSINCPASMSSIVGLKPTVGLVSRSGIVPISHTQDTAGPMTRSVRDAAIVLNAIAGPDESDPITKESAGKKITDYTTFLISNPLQGKRIGVEKSMLKGHEVIDKLFGEAIGQMKAAGATIVEVDLLGQLKVDAEEFEVLKFEFKDGLNRYLAAANAKVKSLKDVIAFNKENEGRVMPHFRQEILEAAEDLGDLNTKEYRDALAKVLESRKIIDRILDENHLQAICGPTNGPSWCIDPVNGDHFTGYGMYSPSAMARYPSISVPMGEVEGLPVGLCFFNSAYQEGILLQVAFGYEQISRNRKKPDFLNTLVAKG